MSLLKKKDINEHYKLLKNISMNDESYFYELSLNYRQNN